MQFVDIAQDDEGLVPDEAGILAWSDMYLKNLAVDERPHQEPVEIDLDALDLAPRLHDCCAVNLLVFIPGELEPFQVGLHPGQRRPIGEIAVAVVVAVLSRFGVALEERFRSAVRHFGVGISGLPRPRQPRKWEYPLAEGRP